MGEKLKELEVEKMTLAAEFEAARESGQEQLIPKLAIHLEALYWRFVEVILADKIEDGSEVLEFTEQEKLLINMGLIDEAFIENPPVDLREKLLEEMGQDGLVNHFYLTEWLEDRYKKYKVNETVIDDKAIEAAADSKYEASRLKVLEKLTPYINGLQGVSPEVASAICTGRLDSQLLSMGENLLEHRMRRDMLTRHRLWDLRRQILNRARALAGDGHNLSFFDSLNSLYQLEWRDLYNESRQSPNDTVEERREKKISEIIRREKQAAQQKACEYLIGELRFIKSLIPLGALAGGILRPMAVMLEDGARVTKQDTAKVLENAAVCDRNFGASPVVLIAPFTGRGIYEWDRDSLVISLRPVSTPADSASNAIANYTMMIDSLQKDAHIKIRYKQLFSEANYQKDFQADYRNWMCNICEGDETSMEVQKLRFFRENVGLDLKESPAISLAPVEMRFLTPQARHIIRTQLRKQVDSAKDSWATRWRLGLLCWIDGDIEEALREITHAAKLVPQQIPQLIGVGLLLAESGRREKAKEILGICLRRGKDSIWKLYASDALKRMAADETTVAATN